jgi:hypothetical protein
MNRDGLPDSHRDLVSWHDELTDRMQTLIQREQSGHLTADEAAEFDVLYANASVLIDEINRRPIADHPG